MRVRKFVQYLLKLYVGENSNEILQIVKPKVTCLYFRVHSRFKFWVFQIYVQLLFNDHKLTIYLSKIMKGADKNNIYKEPIIKVVHPNIITKQKIIKMNLKLNLKMRTF